MAAVESTSADAYPAVLQDLVARYDRSTFQPQGGRARLRLSVTDLAEQYDVVIEQGSARLRPPRGAPEATLTADLDYWSAIARDLRRGLRAFRSGRLTVRQNLHLGIGFLAATSGRRDPERLRFEVVRTRSLRLSTLQAGSGPPLVAVHG